MVMYFHTIHIFFSLMNTFTLYHLSFHISSVSYIVSTLQIIIFVLLFLFSFTNTLIINYFN